MNGSKNTPTRRSLRRAEQRRVARTGFNKRKMATAAGAAFISASIAMGPAVAQAEQINATANAQNSYDTWNNLIIVSDALGKTQRALLAPLGSIAPEGMLPTVSNDKTSTSKNLNFLEGLGDLAGAAVKTPDTSHVPGAAGVFGLGGLAAGLPQYAMALPTALAAVDTVSQVTPKAAATLGALGLVDTATLGENAWASAQALVSALKVNQHAGYALPNLDLSDPTALLGLPGVQYDRSAWNHAYNWPLLQIDGKTWMVQERYTVDPVTSETLKQNFRDQIGTLDTLNVQECKKWVGVCLQWGPVETIYNPNPGVENALNKLNGIDVAGFSLTKREAGGQYNVFGDGSLGWLMSTTQVIIGDQVTTVPVLASGIALPFGLLTVGGQYSPGLVSQNGQTVSGVLGTRSQGWAVPLLGLGVDSTSVLESFQIGPDGIAYNSGWTIAAINAGLGIPLPMVYSMGSFNVGPKGIGYTSPSFFGVGLPSFQLGEAPAGAAIDDGVLGALTGALGSSLPTNIITLDPKYLFGLAGITDPTGLGLLDPFGTAQRLLDPVFRTLITPPATLAFQGMADVGTALGNRASANSVTLTDTLAKLSQKTAKVAEDAPKTLDLEVTGTGQNETVTPPAPVIVETPTEDLVQENPMVITETPEQDAPTGVVSLEPAA